MQDETLQGNEKIEEAVAALQQEPTQEQLAHTLTVLRRRIREGGQLIVAVEPAAAGVPLNLKTQRHYCEPLAPHLDAGQDPHPDHPAGKPRGQLRSRP